MTKSKKRRWPVVLIWLGLVGVLSAEFAVRVSPVLFPSLALAGMAFPLSWVCLMTGAVGSLYQRKWRALRWGLMGIALSAPHASQTWGWSFMPAGLGAETPAWSFSPGASSAFMEWGEDSSDLVDFKVLSWNVRQFDRFGWLNNDSARQEMLSYLHAEGPDLVCIQECFLEENDAPWMTKERLKKALGLPHWAEEYKFGRGQQKLFGLGVLSRFPILNVKAIHFPNDKNNSAMYADVLVGGDTIRAFNVHLSSLHFEDEDYEAMRQGPDESERMRLLDRLQTAWKKRALQAEMVAKHVANSPYPVVLMGDFNDGPVSYARQQFQPYLKDAYKGRGGLLGATYAGDIPGMRIDFIMHSPVLKCLDFNTGEVVLSDHRPIQVRFSLQQ